VPRSIIDYVLRYTGRHQVGLAALSIAVFLLSAVPLELQRRIVNTIVEHGPFATIFWLALAYPGVALAEQSLKLVLNVYRGWVAEDSYGRCARRSGSVPTPLQARKPPKTPESRSP